MNQVRRFTYWSNATSITGCSWCSQTLTTLNLERNEIGNKGVEYLADALKINRVRQSATHRSEIYFIRRASPCWIFATIVSMRKERSTLPMLWIAMKFDAISVYCPPMCHCHSFQTLTTLNLSISRIGAEVMKQFRRDLKVDTVKEDLFIFLFYLMRRSLPGRSSISEVRFKSIVWGWLRRRSNRIRVSICWRATHFRRFIYCNEQRIKIEQELIGRVVSWTDTQMRSFSEIVRWGFV